MSSARGQQTSTLRVAIASSVAALVALASSAIAACSLALDFNGIDDGVRDGSVSTEDAPVGVDAQMDGAPPFDATTDSLAPPLDAPISANDASDAPTSTGDGACPSLPGPTLVPAGSFCIDSTEVTVAQYTAFLTAKAGSTSGQPALCSWNTTFLPFGWPPTGAQDLPVGFANWCQAYMYCEWAGKRLCGAPAGGSANPYEWYDPTQSEWFAACSHDNDGVHTYPYGNTYSPTLCNGEGYDAGQTVPSVATCQGGYPGAFDMSGNVFEWEDSCAPAVNGGTLSGATDYCHTRGGAFDQNSTTLRCDDGTLFSRQSQGADIGFRCCSP